MHHRFLAIWLVPLASDKPNLRTLSNGHFFSVEEWEEHCKSSTGSLGRNPKSCERPVHSAVYSAQY